MTGTAASIGAAAWSGLWGALTRLAAHRPVVVAAVFFVGLWAVLATAEEAATAPRVLDVRTGVDARGQTRIVFDTDERPDFAVSALDGEVLRVTIRNAAFDTPGGEGTGIVPNWLAGEGGADLRLSGPALPVRAFVLPPAGDVSHYRLVIDLEAVSADEYAGAIANDRQSAPTLLAPEPNPDEDAAVAANAVPQPSLKPRGGITSAATPAARPEAPAPSARMARAAHTIVIDPGHGGYDPGASGPAGTKEEAITLSAALTLRTVLQARGYEVVLTREDDSFVELDERVEIARRAHADLFLSLHADAHDDPDVRGASVYTLSDKRAGRMAREIKSGGDFVFYDVALSEEERDVGDILFDIASAETRNASGRLAATLVDELSGRVPMVNNTHRKGSLRVLLSPDVPAVLVEMAFISNPSDEANLTSKRWRRRAMTSVADGIDAYFGERVAQAGADGAAGG